MKEVPGTKAYTTIEKFHCAKSTSSQKVKKAASPCCRIIAGEEIQPHFIIFWASGRGNKATRDTFKH
ncbi:hypothetical protein [Evansella clarkii]|uniref:hypothetical protein n=1 Tax=Evansella clarkii TaxID=79879 RepID=UPI001ADC733E|nr:hypothetical protein [Evansella clarkii]